MIPISAGQHSNFGQTPFRFISDGVRRLLKKQVIPTQEKVFSLFEPHSRVESVINALEHHGLNHCLDVGLEGYVRYVGLGVLAYRMDHGLIL